MRVSPARRRRMNNIIILSVIAAMALLNLPTLIKTYLLEEPTSLYPTLFDPDLSFNAIYYNRWSLEKRPEGWFINDIQSKHASEVAERWARLEGTEVDADMYSQLEASLSAPQSIEVWFKDREEPQRITLYKTDQFWLLRNWQDQWIAISASEELLFPNVQ
ncbi:hypothetical protein [Vibrio mexicanus]|uniref:hypothetical protein n=1 Tax=Vibrio mexicanus TaxID=1004326 RepID=UPI00063C19C3|nr:hypothetical protein [Vibrio mexicanus]